MRSWLFVPGDGERKLEKAASAGADVVIIDLEDAVAADRKAAAREITAVALQDGALAESAIVYVRINAFDTDLVDADLAAVIPHAPAGVMLPKSGGGADVVKLDHYLKVAEAEAGIDDGATAIAVVATETAASLFGLGTYAGSSPRLSGMAWGAEDLSADLGAETNRRDDGTYADPYRLTRSLCLAGARAADVLAIDTVFTDFRNLDGLAAEAAEACRDGFDGKFAIHPDQVAIINDAFTPSSEVINEARRIVDAFKAAPDAGVISLDGRMIDRPHLRQAERLLAKLANL